MSWAECLHVVTMTTTRWAHWPGGFHLLVFLDSFTVSLYSPVQWDYQWRLENNEHSHWLHRSVMRYSLPRIPCKWISQSHSQQYYPFGGLAPVPLSIFRSNSKFDENSERFSFEYTRPITTIFCTRHDSDTVVTCAKYRCDRPRRYYTRVFWIFIEFRIRSKYA